MNKSHLTKLSLAALLATAPAVFAQVHAPAQAHVPAQVEAAPVAEPVPAPVVAEPVPPPPPPVVVPAAAPVAEKPAPEVKPEPAKVASGTKISLYGFAQLNAIWEDGVKSVNANNWNLFAPSDNRDGGNRTLLNVNHTRFGINFSDIPTESGTELSGKIEADFNNNANRNANGATANTTAVSGATATSTANPDDNTVKTDIKTTTVTVPGASAFRIRHAYGQVKFNDLGLTILFGQTSNVFSPRDPSILSEGSMNYSGNIGTSRVPQIRLTQLLGPAELAVAAVDDRGASAPVAPAFQGRIGFKTSADWADKKQNLELGVSGHFANEKNTDIDSNKTPSVPKSWSVNADLNIPIIDILGLSGEAFYGQNLGNYGNGSLALTSSSNTKDTVGIKSFGFWANLGLKLPANLTLGGGFGMESIKNDDELNAKTRSSNTGIFGNLRYNFIPSAFVGIEYWHISTSYTDSKDKDGNLVKNKDGSINRVELAFNYAFK